MNLALRFAGFAVALAVVVWHTSACAPEKSVAAPVLDAEALVLSLDEVKQITDFAAFERSFELEQPKPQQDPSVPPPCRALFDQRVAFGDRWTGFRFVSDEGDLDVGGQLSLIAMAQQTVAVYATPEAARDAFDRRLAMVTECVQLRFPYHDPVITRPDANTAVLGVVDWTMVCAVKSAVDTSVIALPETGRIASEMSRRITERVT